MVITLEPHGIFGPNYEYLYIFTLSRHCWFSYKIYWNIVQPLVCKMGRSSHFSENAHNSWTTRKNFDKIFAYLYILTLSRHCWFSYKSDVHLPFYVFVFGAISRVSGCAVGTNYVNSSSLELVPLFTIRDSEVTWKTESFLIRRLHQNSVPLLATFGIISDDYSATS